MVKKKIEIQGLKINFYQAGGGTPFLLLHGWGGSSASLQKLGANLVKNNFQVIIPDLPGFGQSTPPQKVWTTAAFAKFLWSFSKRLNVQKFFLFGHSFGGCVAVHFCRRHQREINGLILCAPSGILKRKSFKINFFWLLAKAGKIIFTLPPFCFLKATARQGLYFLIGERDYFQSRGLMKKIFQKVNQEDLRPFLAKIRVKTLLIWGREDKLVSPADGEIFQKEIRQAHLELISGGHDLPLKKPRLLANLITRFLAES